MTFADRITRLPQPFDRDLGTSAREAQGWASGDVARLIEGTAGSSPYLAGLIAREGDWLEGALAAPVDGVVPGVLADLPGDPAALGPALRQAKRRVALFAALADLSGVWGLEDVTGALTALADRATDAGLRALLAAEDARGKLPGGRGEDGTAGMVAFAMGKMGARELNYSSDIDLIVLFDEARGEPDDLGERRAALVKVTRRLAAMLSDITAEGYVFRTDLRLRPDASVTPVCLSMDAAEQYYESVGRTWERAAWIKARAAAGDIAAGEAFIERLRPFVWRRHLDFAAIQDAHDMRLRIRDHKDPRGQWAQGLEGRDIKLGPGGIREIEFFTQTRQLIAGGRDPDLRARDTLGGLAALAQKGWVPQEAADLLADDYRAHRELEHRLQMVNDAQTQSLPTTEEGFARIACLMGTTPDALRADVAERLRRVKAVADSFFAPPEGKRAQPELSDAAQEITARWTSYPALRSRRSVEIFNRLRPELLERLNRTGRPEQALPHLDAFLRGLPAGVQLFSLFEANPALIDLLVDIAATAPLLAEYLGRNSAVLDAVIAGDFFRPLPDCAEMTGALQRVLDGAPDYEGALNAARAWWREVHFRIGVHHLRGMVDGLGAGHAYAALAEAVLAGLWPVVIREFSVRHGPPPGKGAAVIGMGSLGAGWLTAASDLDLLVIYDADGAEMSEGRKPLAVRAYYSRLTQALVTAMSAPMAAGRLYEVDMRLRPSGRQGPVATALGSFDTYQDSEAWTWEHLALTRARALAGPAAIGEAVEDVRCRVITRRHDPARVLTDLRDMRARIAAARGEGAIWDVKAGAGGAQDIELYAQGLALLAGSADRATAQQIAAGEEAGLIPPEAAACLSEAHDLQQRLRTAMRLLTGTAQDPEALGPGAVALIAREAEVETTGEVEARLRALRQAAAEAIAAGLPEAGDEA